MSCNRNKSQNEVSSNYGYCTRVRRRFSGNWLTLCLFFVLFALLILPSSAVASEPAGEFQISNPSSGEAVDADTSLKISWTRSANAEGYKIALRDLTTNVKLLDNEDLGSKRSYTVRNLEGGHSYRVAVCAYSSGGDFWIESEFTALIPPPSGNPEIISVTPSPKSATAGSTFSFMVNANDYTEEVGVEVDGNLVGTTTSYSTRSGNHIFTIDAVITSPGINRAVVAYAYQSGRAIRGSEATNTITVTESEPVGVPTITSPSFADSFVVGETFIARWQAPSTNPDSYNIYLYCNGNLVYSENGHSSKSVKIPGSSLSSAGTYSLDVYAIKSGYKADAPGNLKFTVLEKPVSAPSNVAEPVPQASSSPAVYSVSVSPSSAPAGSTFTFTVTANSDVKKIGVEVDGHSVGTTTRYSAKNGNRVFTVASTITSAGNYRSVVAYAYDGDSKLTNAAASTTISVTDSPSVGVPTIISPTSGSSHTAGESLSVSWLSPPTEPTSYNVYLYYNGAVVYSKKGVSGKSLTIPDSSFQSAGTYSLEVYAVKEGYKADSPANIFISVIKAHQANQNQVQEPVTPSSTTPKIQSVTASPRSAPTGSTFTFTITANDAVKQIGLEAGGQYVGTSSKYSMQGENHVFVVEMQVSSAVSDLKISAYAMKEGSLLKSSAASTTITATSTKPQVEAAAAQKTSGGDILDVPYYMQSDSKWGSQKLGTSSTTTIKGAGCTITSLAMVHEYETGVVCTPDQMNKMLTFSGANVQWDSVTNLGYVRDKSMRSPNNLAVKMNAKTLDIILTRLKDGHPVIIGVSESTNYDDNTHYVVINGYTGDGSTPSDLTIRDPNSKTRTTLQDLLDKKSYVHTLVYSSGKVSASQKQDVTPVTPTPTEYAEPSITDEKEDFSDTYEIPQFSPLGETDMPDYVHNVLSDPDTVQGYGDKSQPMQSNSPKVHKVTASPSRDVAGSTFTFTVTTNQYTNTVCVEVDGYQVGTSSNSEKKGNTRIFTVTSRAITSPGVNRQVVAYAYDPFTYEKYSGTSAKTRITVTEEEEIVFVYYANELVDTVKNALGISSSNSPVVTADPITPFEQSDEVTNSEYSGLSTSQLIYDAEWDSDIAALRGNTERENALRAVMDKYANQVTQKGQSKVIYFIEGYGSDLSVDGRSSALCVVVRGGKVIFACENCATLPDQPLYKNTNDGDPVPNVVDGVYLAYALNHESGESNYPAMHISNPNIVRVINAGTSSDESRHINIHKKITDNAVSEKSDWANSAGCFLVGHCNSKRASKEFDRFAAIIGFAKDVDGNGYAETRNKIDKFTNCGYCIVVVDRAYGYSHVAEFVTYMQEKYRKNNDTIDKIIGLKSSKPTPTPTPVPTKCTHTLIYDGLCPNCGYYDTKIITVCDSWTGKVSKTQKVYTKVSGTTPSGFQSEEVWATDTITVLGTLDEFYLIQYPTSSGDKVRFIEKAKVF